MARETAATRVEAAVLTGCGRLKAIIKALDAEIKRLGLDIRKTRDRIKQAQDKPKPDSAEIKALQQESKALEGRLAKDEADVSELRDVVRENCS